MACTSRLLIAMALLSSFPAVAGAQLLSSADTAIAIDLDAVFVPSVNNGRYPALENPAKALDGLASTKYLNFGDCWIRLHRDPHGVAELFRRRLPNHDRQ